MAECLHAAWRPADVSRQFGGSVVSAAAQAPPRQGRRLLGRAQRRRPAGESPAVREQDAAPVPAVAESRLDMLLDRVANNLAIWRLLQDATGMRVHYVLQPVLGWTAKPLTEQEKSSFEADLAGYPYVGWYARAPVYSKVLGEIEAAANEAGIRFHNANEWLAAEEATVFVDVCHYCDDGQRILARQVAGRLDWLDG